MLERHSELEVIRELYEYRDYLEIVKEMRKCFPGMIVVENSETHETDVERAINISLIDDQWFALVDPCDDQLLSIAFVYGSFVRDKAHDYWMPFMTLMVYTPEEHRRKGFAERMVPEVVRRMHLHGALIDSSNIASQRLFSKLGYVKKLENVELVTEEPRTDMWVKGAK